MPSLTVDLDSHSYPIHIEAGALDRAGSLLTETLHNRPCLVIADATVADKYGERLLASFAAQGITSHISTFPAGEPSKNVATAEALWQDCARYDIDRGGVIIALGGGVSGDLAGFVAACWMRGVRFVQIPTSLLAMVDSSVGGKTGVNSAAGKNLIGAFHQPKAVLIDPELLHSMSARQYAAGLAEVLKYGVIREPDFFTWQEGCAAALLAREASTVTEAVAVSCRTKAWYVANDERESGVRAHLNYGHTFGHALERETGYTRYLHGEAVAIGMRMAAALAQELQLLDDPDLPRRQDELLAAYGLPLRHELADRTELDRLLGHCHLDKKVQQGHTRFVIARAPGRVEMVTDPPLTAVRTAFEACC